MEGGWDGRCLIEGGRGGVNRRCSFIWSIGNGVGSWGEGVDRKGMEVWE